MQRQFVLCLGASKSGTTWLYHYLKSYDFADMGIRKEYNALCPLFGMESGAGEVKPPNLNSPLGQKIARDQAVVKRMGQSLENYVQHFDDLLQNGKKLSGDISPSYIRISAAQLTSVRQAFLDRGIRPVTVLLLRDPVARILSAARMAQRLRVIRIAGRTGRNSSFAELVDVIARHHFTDYKTVIQRVERAAPPEARFIYPYEQFISPDGVSAFSHVLGIPPRFGLLDKHVNSNGPQGAGEMSEVNIAGLRSQLAEQYAFCSDYFQARGIALDWTFASARSAPRV